ncbi:hypothetical protein [Wolbachia endosymbiont of Wuchereria bancrofti]|uniref:hypothetical protein n=1 Tax=Wolbachia endosymbiont of Wuchereria bancrofti TaxID=96496 RepID=UPI000B4D372B|nr:hypothetical protein [Wolbachia endosymbiont of Wuchereria bancrofti]
MVIAGLAFTGPILTALAIIGIAIAAGLAAGAIGGTTYAVLQPSNSLDEPNVTGQKVQGIKV